MHTKLVIKALTAKKHIPYTMAKASYAHARAYNLSIKEAIIGAITIFLEYRNAYKS